MWRGSFSLCLGRAPSINSLRILDVEIHSDLSDPISSWCFAEPSKGRVDGGLIYMSQC